MNMSQPAGSSKALRPRLSVVVPCHNEAAVLAETHDRISQVCTAVAGDSYEIVFVNDGSTDGTWALMQNLATKGERVVCVDLSRNFGHQAALMEGLREARGERVLVLDADLQDPPELLTDMWSLMEGGAEVVYGHRLSRDGETWFKRHSASFFYRVLNRLSDVRIPTDVGDFRLMSRPVVDALVGMPEAYPFVRGMVAWAGFRQVALSYNRSPRHGGSTSYSMLRMLALALDGVTGFSVAPLRLISQLAFGTMLLSLVLACYSIYGWLALSVVPGWTSLFSLVLFMGSLQLLSLGVIGEYVGRTFMEAKRRPLAVVRQVLRVQP